MGRDKGTLFKRVRHNLKYIVPKPLRRKRSKREYSPEELEDLKEFTGLPEDSILEYVLRRRGRRISDEFVWLDPRNAGEYAWFYRGSRTYLFAADGAWERAVAMARPGMRILDFGGGGGRNSLGMAAQGAEVHYVDIGILNARFTAFRAKKRGLDLTVIDPLVEVDGRWQVDTAEAARQVGGFDLVVADNVLEHVHDYHLALEKLVAALKPTGRVLECTPFKRPKARLFGEPEWDVHLTPKMPMADAMARCGMRPVEGAEPGLWERAPA